MKKKPVISVILCTARKDRLSIHVSKYITSVLKAEFPTYAVKHVDIADFLIGKTVAPWQKGGKKVEAWRKMADKTHTFVLVTPEYNQSFPGELKIALDCAMDEYKNKRVLVAGVSAGTFGGSRVINHLVQPLLRFGLKISKHALYFSKSEEFSLMKKKERDQEYRQRIIKTVKAVLR